MLALIGIGLDTKDISIRALDFIKTADIVLYDRYTSIINTDALSFIKEYTQKDITEVKRSALEENVNETIKSAKEKNIVILVIGDPLVATTHHIILQEARKLGIQTKIFHSSSVFSAAIGESGLDIYKFGPTTTIPFWSENYKPISFIHFISKNIENGQHTLVLLDINQKNGDPMKLSEAMSIIDSAITPQYKVNYDTKLIVMADVGRQTQDIIYTTVSKLKDLSGRFDGKTLCMVFPGNLNFAEQEDIARFS